MVLFIRWVCTRYYIAEPLTGTIVQIINKAPNLAYRPRITYYLILKGDPSRQKSQFRTIPNFFRTFRTFPIVAEFCYFESNVDNRPKIETIIAVPKHSRDWKSVKNELFEKIMGIPNYSEVFQLEPNFVIFRAMLTTDQR